MNGTTPPINNKTKSQQVEEHILGRIKNGEWPTGTKLPGEMDLAEQFGVSRVSIRAAIAHLAGQGFLVVRHGEGTFINAVSPDAYFDNLKRFIVMEPAEYAEVQRFRFVMEPAIAFEAALYASLGQIEALEKTLQQQIERYEKNDWVGFIEADQRFHGLLAEATGNRLVIQTMKMMEHLMHVAMEHTMVITGFSEGIEMHHRILQCIRSKKPNAAATTMREHIQNNINTWEEVKEDHQSSN